MKKNAIVLSTFILCFLRYLESVLRIPKFNKKVKTNVERESIFIIKSHQTGPQFQMTFNNNSFNNFTVSDDF